MIMNISADLIRLETYSKNVDLSISVDIVVVSSNTTMAAPGPVSPIGAVRRLNAIRAQLPLAGLRGLGEDPGSNDLMKNVMPLYGGDPSLLLPFGKDGKQLSATDHMVQIFSDTPRLRQLQAGSSQEPPEIYMQPTLHF